MPSDERPSGAKKKRPKPLALSVYVPSEDQGYPVLVGTGLLGRIGHELKRSRKSAKKVALISDANVMPLYGDKVATSLEEEGLEVVRFVVPAGEASKSPAQLFELVEGMLDTGFGRRDAAVALGGGVVGDLGGLAAALFMRGIPVLQCPTTLLAQVDASVGGKVAIDLPGGKNLLGTFHFPTAVVIDPEVLATLPERELACGAAEMLKHGTLFSEEHFDDVVRSAEAIRSRDAEHLGRLVASSVALKAACVSRDPREQGEAGKGRVVLNLGHTVGHALEAVSNFELLHGEAVALGLRAAARLSARKGLCKPELETRIAEALTALELPVDLDAWLDDARIDAIEASMANDKKRGGGTLSYIGLTEIGQPTVLSLTPGEIVTLLRR